jgi:hypothetical protein
MKVILTSIQISYCNQCIFQIKRYLKVVYKIGRIVWTNNNKNTQLNQCLVKIIHMKKTPSKLVE